MIIVRQQTFGFFYLMIYFAHIDHIQIEFHMKVENGNT